jgi:phage-related holin
MFLNQMFYKKFNKYKVIIVIAKSIDTVLTNDSITPLVRLFFSVVNRTLQRLVRKVLQIMKTVDTPLRQIIFSLTIHIP